MPGLWGAVCQWHTFSTDRSEYEDTKYGTIRKAFFDTHIIISQKPKNRIRFLKKDNLFWGVKAITFFLCAKKYGCKIQLTLNKKNSNK